MKNKNIFFIITIAVLTIALAISLFFLFTNKPEVANPTQQEEPIMKVMSHVRLKHGLKVEQLLLWMTALLFLS